MTLPQTANPKTTRRSSYGDRQSTVRFGRSKASEVLGELSVKEVQVGEGTAMPHRPLGGWFGW